MAATPQEIHGLGLSALEYTDKKADGSADHVPETSVDVCVSTRKEVDVEASLPAGRVLAIARQFA